MSCRGRRLCTVVLAFLMTTLFAPWPHAHAIVADPDLSVTITALAPSSLTESADVTMSGTVTNNNDYAWDNVQAYLVMPRAPFTSRAQISSAVSSGGTYTGERIVALDSIDNLDTIGAGQSTSFTVRVPWAELGLTGAQGIYPVGVQLLGTNPDGERSNRAIGRATTFLPLIAGEPEATPASVLWPFLMPDHRDAAGVYANPSDLVAAVSAGGQLRNLLDLASSMRVRSGTVVIDPALLDGLTDLVEGRHLDDDDLLDEAEQQSVTRFKDDLLALTRRGSTWNLGYGLPDQLALTRNNDVGAPLREAINRATDDALSEHGLSARRATWLGQGGVTAELLEQLRRSGDQPFIVHGSDLPEWDRRDGSVVSYASGAGPLPLVITDDISAGVPGTESVTTIRQRILAESALAILQQGIDPSSRADAVTVIPPTWDPGTDWRSGGLDSAWSTPWVGEVTLDDLLLGPLTSYDGDFSRPTVSSLDRTVLAAASELAAASTLLDTITVAEDTGVLSIDRRVAGLVGIRWRDDGATSIEIAEAERAAVGRQLEAISIEGPPSFLLSGTQGQFPLTISNNTPNAVSLGVRISSSNPALEVPEIDQIEIGAGERNTLNVVVDVGRQKTSTLTAELVTADGVVLGEPSVFNVRSSNVGTIIWIAMGAAGSLLAIAIARRFLVKHPTPDDDSGTEDSA